MQIAIIPARGGSKRIPQKNIRQFAGRPMISHSIGVALRSELFDRVIVSTDDEQIARVARECGAEVPFMRPAQISDDHASTAAVITHAIRWLTDEHGKAPEVVCCLYATAPFVQTDDLRAGLALLRTGAWRFVFAATPFATPIFRSFEQRSDGGLRMFFPEHITSRSQDLPEALHDAGQFYWATSEAWLAGAAVFGPTSTVVRVPRWRVQDIDTEEDWRRAEIMAGHLLG